MHSKTKDHEIHPKRPAKKITGIVLLVLSILAATSAGCALFQITCSTPEISPSSGNVTPGSTITITTSTKGVAISYTLDGSDPSQSNGTIYTGPFLLSSSCTIKAIAYRDSYNDSEIASASYTIDTSESVAATLSTDPVQTLEGGRLLNMSLDLGSSNSDVYFVFSNGSTANSAALPVEYNPSQRSTPLERTATTESRTTAPLSSSFKHSGSPSIDKANAQIRSEVKNGSLKSGSAKSKSLSKALTVGTSTLTFYGDTSTSSDTTDQEVALTLRFQSAAITTQNPVDTSASTPDYSRTLRIWVANDCWAGNTSATKAYKVTQAMVDAYGALFLAAGTNNDIYDWVTNIFGPEWGNTDFSGLIGPTGAIDIILYDIDGDNSTTGGVLGYFYSRDNTTSIASSNQMLCFSIDAVMFADPRNASGTAITWSLADSYWPNEMVSTLAHEFQHMISFYQNISDSNVLSWVEEMMSLCAEDLVADKIQAVGPRGVSYDDYSSGSSSNSLGRIPEFNYLDDTSLTNWDSKSGDYALAYAFGAWMLRNFGGTELVQAIRSQTDLDTPAVVKAVNERSSSSYSFGELLALFGASVLLSDSTNQAAPLLFNAGQAASTPIDFVSQANSLSYNLGDINFFNYTLNMIDSNTGEPISQVGPWINSTGTTFGYWGALYPGSNNYYCAGKNLTGSQNWLIYIPAGVLLTVVQK